MSGLERCAEKTSCPAKRGVRIREVTVLERCPEKTGVLIREVSILERCSDYRGVRIIEVSGLQFLYSQYDSRYVGCDWLLLSRDRFFLCRTLIGQ